MKYLKTEHGKTPVIVEGIFPVTKEEAFEAWTNPDEVVQWLGENPNSMINAKIDLKVGGKLSLLFIDTEEKTGTLEGKYLEIIENEKLVFDWQFYERFNDGNEIITEQSIVTIVFKEDPKGTKITLTHSEIDNRDGRLSVGSGWNGTFNNYANRIAQP